MSLINIKIFQIIFSDVKIERRDTAKLRAYIAGGYPQFSELHNHMPDGKPIYRYPVIQYKVIDAKPMIIGLNHGCDILENFILDVEKLEISGHDVEINEKHVIKKNEEFGICNSEVTEYKFKNPWFALNSDNYQKYIDSNTIEKIKLLEKILIGNIISISKGFGYTVKSEIKCRLMVTPLEIKLKDKTMLGFTGNFMVNFKMPNLIGIGKMVSRGFGAIERVKIV